MTISRRTFLTALSGGLVARPLVGRAQSPTMPVVGFLSSLRASDRARILPSFHRGLGEAGYLEGRNLAIEYRWAEGQYDRLPELAADLVQCHVVAIAAISGTPGASARVVSIWFLPAGEEVPRFVTAYPEGSR